MIGILALLSTLIFSLFEISSNLELLSLDARFRIRPEIKKSQDIVLVNFDDPSLEQFGSWPWSRFHQVVLLDVLRGYATGPIIFDVLFTEPEPPVVIARDRLSGVKGKDTALQILNPDREFAGAIKKSGEVFLAYATRDPSLRVSQKDISSETERLRKGFVETKNHALLFMESTLTKTPPAVEPFIYKSVDLEPPLIELLKAARGYGFAQPGYSTDGTIRKFIIFRHYNGYLLTPLALSAFAHFKGLDIENPAITPEKEIGFRYTKEASEGTTRGITIPVDKHLQALLNWPGTFEGSFTHVSFREIAHLYAFHRAIEIASRAAKTKSSNPKDVKALIIKEIEANNLTSNQKLQELASKAVAAVWAREYLKKGYTENHIRRLLGSILDDKSIEEIFFSVSIALRAELFLQGDPKGSFDKFIEGLELSGIDKTMTLEIFNETRKSLKKATSKDKTRHLFPQRIEAISNGIKVSLSPYDLEGKIILVGLTGRGTVDLSPTPFEKSCPMVFYHASAINMLLNESFLHYPPKGFAYFMAIIFVLLIGFTSIRYSVTFLSLLFVSALLTYLLSAYWLWVNRGLWLEVVTPLFALFTAYLIAMVTQFLKIYSEKSKVRHLFSAMVSPVVLSVMERHPESFSLTGQRRHATTYFSKIDGLERLTRSFTPEQLPIFLSSYLTPMSNIIMEYGGYIDKYEGAVIMADFGVPLEDRDNVYKCAYAALEQVAFARSFRYALSNRYNSNMKVSIGFNSGYVSAGNMGSDRKFQYTVMGDAVNIAARFMAANSIYCSEYPLTGQDTVSLLADFIYARPLDKLMLKGKTIAIKVYDVLGWKAAAYREIMKGKPVPAFLKSLWTMPLAESVNYYADYWERQHSRSDHPLSHRIFTFFRDHCPYADEWIIYEYLLDALRVKEDILSLAEKLGGNSSIHRYGSDCNALIASCKEELEGIREELRFLEENEPSVQRIEVLDNKLSQLSIRKNSYAEVFEDRKVLIDSLLKNTQEELQRGLLDIKLRYKSEAERFIGTIKAREYHELLSITGEPEHKEMISLFDQGLSLYWNRQWDEAIEVFHRAISIDSTDYPAIEMIKRIQSYKKTPPHEGWQGEFIQTKK